MAAKFLLPFALILCLWSKSDATFFDRCSRFDIPIRPYRSIGVNRPNTTVSTGYELVYPCCARPGMHFRCPPMKYICRSDGTWAQGPRMPFTCRTRDYMGSNGVAKKVS